MHTKSLKNAVAAVEGLPEERAAALKRLTYEFLQSVRETLNDGLPGPGGMALQVRQAVTTARRNENDRHLRLPEGAFVNKMVLPLLSQAIQDPGGLSREEAREALLAENFRHVADISKRSPVRSKLHPFGKSLGAKPSDVYARWTVAEGHQPLVQACPDFALTAPFPIPMVFEAKYFADGSPEKARRALATGIYEAFFYRSLPAVPQTRHRPAWEYDYACLLVFDASPNGTLMTAWTSLGNKVRRSFWESANIYVMVLRGNNVEGRGL